VQAQDLGGTEDDDAAERDAATAQAALAALTQLLTDPRMLHMLIQEPGADQNLGRAVSTL
jgi:hypothetical protein